LPLSSAFAGFVCFGFSSRAITANGKIYIEAQNCSGAYSSVHCAFGARRYVPSNRSSVAHCINASGQIAGSSPTITGFDRAFVYQAGALTNLGATSSDTSRAWGINDGGSVVGSASAHAVLYDGSGTHDLGTLGGTRSEADAINGDGIIVGYSDVNPSGTSPHAFRYVSNSMQDLGTLGGKVSEALAIDSAGQITGDSATSTGSTHAFLYSSGVMTDINGTAGGSHGRGINDSGDVVGDIIPVSFSHAFLYTGGTIKDLGTLGGSNSWADDINNKGQIVGRSWISGIPPTTHAFVYDAGVMRDLNSLMDSSASGWTLIEAFSVNDSGWICGYGRSPTGSNRAVLLTPLPEPTTALTLSFLTVLGGRQCRRGRARKPLA